MIPVGRAETTRKKGEGEKERVADDDFGNNARKRERGEDGRERRDQDQCNTQKSGGEGVPIDVGTGGVRGVDRGSDERGDRTAEERQKRVQTESEVTNDRGTCTRACKRECKQERQEVKCDRLGCWGMEDSSWEGRNDQEGRGRGGESG
jgi:hypothetical protein